MTREPYLDHAAVLVKNFELSIEFFDRVFGMKVKRTTEPGASPRQVWLEGGVQLVDAPDFAAPEGRLGHLGIKVADCDAALALARPYGIVPVPGKPPAWFALPEGLVIELLPME